jgi:hypothetical protein
MRSSYILTIAAVVGGFAWWQRMQLMSSVKGTRNKNPGNIRWDQRTQWQGMTGADDDGFIVFESVEWGIRAMARVLNSYRNRGVITLGNIITTWAPAEDNNNTRAYVDHVSQITGFSESDEILPSDWPHLIAAIIHHENGIQPYSMSLIQRGIELA